MTIPVLIYTDAGRDVDDVEAITYLVGSPNVEIVGVVTTHMIPDRRAFIARTVLDNLGKTDVPIGVGSIFPIGKDEEVLAKYLKEHTIEGKTYEGEGLIECFHDGVDLIHELIGKYGSQLKIAVQAPLTDLAKAALKDEENFCKVGGLYIQGQAIVDGLTLLTDNNAYNIKEDEEASRIIFGLQDRIELTFVGKHAAYEVPFLREDFALLASTGNPVGRYLKIHAEKGLECFAIRAPDIFKRVFGVDANKVHELKKLSNPYDALVAKAIGKPDDLSGVKVGKHTLIGMNENNTGVEDPELVKSDLMNTMLKALKGQ